MEKEWLIGGGKEHKVYLPPGSEYVVKVPRRYHMSILNLFFDGPQTVVQDLVETQRLIRETNGRVQLPTTMVLFTKDGYRMPQKYIKDDPTVEDVSKKLKDMGQTYLAGRAKSSRDNFAVEAGKDTIYILDPTLFWFSRLVKQHPKLEKAWRSSLKVKNTLKDKAKALIKTK